MSHHYGIVLINRNLESVDSRFLARAHVRVQRLTPIRKNRNRMMGFEWFLAPAKRVKRSSEEKLIRLQISGRILPVLHQTRSTIFALKDTELAHKIATAERHGPHFIAVRINGVEPSRIYFTGFRLRLLLGGLRFFLRSTLRRRFPAGDRRGDRNCLKVFSVLIPVWCRAAG